MLFTGIVRPFLGKFCIPDYMAPCLLIICLHLKGDFFMLNIKKQIRNIYAISVFGSFQIAGASWVVLLAARGFSLLETGVAESAFSCGRSFIRDTVRRYSGCFWQEKSLFKTVAELKLAGMKDGMLGPALFIIGLGGAVGAKLVAHLKKWSYMKISCICAIGISMGMISIVTKTPFIMCTGGFIASLSDDLLQVRSDIMLNNMIPSSQRATLISVSSLCFSVVMIMLSPVMGFVLTLFS